MKRPKGRAARKRDPIAALRAEVRRLAVEVHELREELQDIRDDVDCLELDSHSHDEDEQAGEPAGGE